MTIALRPEIGVNVYEQFRSVTPVGAIGVQTACIVGELNQVESDKRYDPIQSYTGVAVTLPYPGLRSLAIPKFETVSVGVVDSSGVKTIVPKSTIRVQFTDGLGSGPNTIDSASVPNWVAVGVVIGDLVQILTGANAGDYVVTASNVANIDITPALPAPAAPAFEFRVLSHGFLTHPQTLEFTPAAVAVTGEVVVSYVAVRTDFCDQFLQVSNTFDLLTAAGPFTEANPLGLAMSLALQNMTGDEVLLGLGLRTRDIFGQTMTVTGTFSDGSDPSDTEVTSASVPDWTTTGIEIGDTLEIMSGANAGHYTVTAVTAGSLGVSPDVPDAAAPAFSFRVMTAGFVTARSTLSDSTAHAIARDVLTTKKVAYFVVPLTQDPAIIASYHNHALEISDPLERWWEMILVNHRLRDRDVRGLATGVGSVAANSAVFSTTSPVDFILEGVTIGDFLLLTDTGGVKNAYPIISVAASTVTVSNPFPSNRSGISYEIVQSFFTKAAQAEDVGIKAQAYNSRRTVMVWPDLLTVTPSDSNTEIEVPGYYLCAAYAGLLSANRPETPMSKRLIGGINHLKHANDYFNRLQLRTIESGGISVWVQPQDDRAPELAHQFTTSQGSLQESEISMVRQVDWIARDMRDGLCFLTGRNNVTDDTLRLVNFNATAILRRNIADGHILDGKVTDVSPDPDFPDHVRVAVALKLLTPMNVLNVTLFI